MAGESATLGASFAIDVTDLKAGINQANRLIRESETEFKSAASGMDNWQESEEGLTAKIKQLNTTTDLQRKKVDALTNQYDELIRGGMDPASKEAVELRTKINNETTALNKNQKELEKNSDALEDLSKNGKKAAESTEETSGALDKMKAVGGAAAAGIAGVAAACVGAVGAFLGLAESTRETRTAFAKLETGFETAGLSAKDAENTIGEMYGVLGDLDKANEASAFLGQMADNEQELAGYTNILTGVYATFGDSLPVEGLAEAMNHTAELGTVQGNLADALEWSGMNVDDFNAQLATCNSVEERQALIASTLNGIYDEAADKYRENNAEVIAANEAQMALTKATAELGAVAEPIMTTLKTMAAELLTSITPFVTLIGEGLKGALEGTSGATEKLAEGLSGIFTALFDKIQQMLPTIVGVIVQIVPQIVSSLLGQLPSIVSMLSEMAVQVINTLSMLIPKILIEIVGIIPQVVNSLLSAVPQLLKAAITFLMAIVDAIPVIIENLLMALPSVIDTLISALLDSIPLLLDAAIRLLMSIVNAIPKIVKSLVAALPLIIDSVISGLLKALPLLLDAAITLFMSIVQAIPVIISELIPVLPQIISTIQRALLNAMPQILKVAFNLFLQIVKAIPKMCVELAKSLPTIISTIVSSLGDGIGDIFDIGKDIVKGLWNGINDMAGWIGKKIKGFGEGVLGGIKDFFGIHSPSTVMENVVGKNLALGIGKGFEDSIGEVNKEIQNAIDIDTDPTPTRGSSGGKNPKTGGGIGGVTVYQTNNYSQAHSRIELYKTKQATAAAVRLAVGTV